MSETFGRFKKLKTRRRKGYTVIYWLDCMTGQVFGLPA